MTRSLFTQPSAFIAPPPCVLHPRPVFQSASQAAFPRYPVVSRRKKTRPPESIRFHLPKDRPLPSLPPRFTASQHHRAQDAQQPIDEACPRIRGGSRGLWQKVLQQLCKLLLARAEAQEERRVGVRWGSVCRLGAGQCTKALHIIHSRASFCGQIQSIRSAKSVCGKLFAKMDG